MLSGKESTEFPAFGPEGLFYRFPIFFNAVSLAKNDRRPVDFNGLAGAGILPAGTLEKNLKIDPVGGRDWQPFCVSGGQCCVR